MSNIMMMMNFKSIKNTISNIPMPSSINYNWNLGSMLGIILVIQMITGLMLSFHYSSSMTEAFESVINISRNINNGWFIRSMHMNGASLFFLIIYIHTSKNLLNSSYSMKITWSIGVMMIMLLMATSFMGYVLPWGQMSFWAATVITNLLSAIPVWGKMLVNWLWGGFSVSAPTLTRFFSLHFLLPFMIAMLSIFHIISLHVTGSSNPIMIQMNKDKINFHPFFTSKDLISMIILMILFFLMMCMYPYISADPENFTPANPMVTPIHIQPEWYFLFAYTILRSIPNKLGGVIALVMSILILMIKSIQNYKKTSFKFNKMKFIYFSTMTHIFLILTWIGMMQVEYPFTQIGLLYSTMYFLIIMLI